MSHNNTHPLRLGTDHLWFGVVFIAAACYASLFPLGPNDFWWHLKVGQIIMDTGNIPDTNLFSWTLSADAPYTYGAWLGEYLLVLLYRLGGLEMVTFSRNFIVGITFFLLGRETKRRTGSWRLAALSVGLVALMTLDNLVVRPQMWAWLPFMLCLTILSKFADRQLKPGWLFLIPIIIGFWVNAHGSFIIGCVLVGIFIFGEVIRTAAHLPGALDWRMNGYLLLTGLFSGVATLVNPLGFGIVGYVSKLLNDQSSQKLIMEWQSPTPEGVASIIFYITVLILLVAIKFTLDKPTPSEVVLILAFTWLAWSGQRYILWYGLVVMPVLVQAVASLPIRKMTFVTQVNWLNTFLILFFLIPLILVQPWFVENIPLSDKYWAKVYRNIPQGPLISVETPLGSADYLRTHPGGKLFNEMGYGSYLIWAVPEQKVFIDPRVELYPFQQWEDYLDITNCYRYNDRLADYGADRILLDKSLQPELTTCLTSDPVWELEYQDTRAQLWKKR